MIFFRRSPDYDPNWEMTLPMRFRNWTSGWRGALVLCILITSGLIKWKGAEAYTWVKVQRAERFLAESEAARGRGDMKEVAEKLKLAMALLHRHPTTLRAVARYQIEMQDLSALNTYTELLKMGEATLEDKVTFAREAFRLGRPELAVEVFAELKENPQTKDKATVLALQAGHSAWEGRWQEALNLASRARAAPGDDQDRAYAESVLARLLLQPAPSHKEDAEGFIRQGIDLVSSLALRTDSTGLESLEMLVSLSQNQQMAPFFIGKDVSKLMDAAEKNPQASPALKIGIWSLRLAAEPAKRSEITQALYQRYKDDPSGALRLEAARWLNQRGMHKMVLDLAEPSKLETEDWLLVYLDATAALGNWEEVFGLVSDKKQDIPLAPTLRKLFKLRSEIETGRKPDLAASWRDIEIASRTETARNQLYVAGYAEQIGFPAEAARIYGRLLDREEDVLPAADKLNRPRRLSCYTGLLRTAAGTMKLEQLCAHMSAFAEEFPEIDEVQNDSAYLQLLAGRDIAKAASTAERLLQKKPELLAYRTTAALGALRREQMAAVIPGGGGIDWSAAGKLLQQQTELLPPRPIVPVSDPAQQKSVAAIYDGWAIDWSTAQDRFKAVYVAVMRAADRTAEAEKVAVLINPANLRAEERALAGLP